MTFHCITLFPEAFSSYLGESILKRAIEDKKIKVLFYNPKDFGPKAKKGRELTYAERRVDDKPYGGGPGMVLEALPVARAIEKAIGRKSAKKKVKIIFFSPTGEKLTTDIARKTAEKYTDVIFVCGRYEGIDARVKSMFKMSDISVGDYVLTGGELPAMIMMDTVSRQIQGVLGNFSSREEERTASPLVYTRPEVIVFKGKKYKVPPVLLSGHAKKIEEWKQEKRNETKFS